MLYKIFLFLTIIDLYNLNEIKTFIYPEEKLRMKNICAISGVTKRILGSNTYSNSYLYLKTHCSKNERCYNTEEGIYQCGKKIHFQKIGEDCGVNEECYTGLCFFGKCSSIGNDEDCTAEKDDDNPEKVCNPGHWCYEHDSLNHLFKCVPYVGEGEIYDTIDGKICRIGLEPHPDATLFDKCTKIGSLENGVSTKNNILCQTGFSEGYDTETEELADNVEKKCFTVVTDSPCESEIVDVGGISQEIYFCKPIVDGLDKFVVEIKIKCNLVFNTYICPYTKGKEKCFKDYISIFNTINIDEVYADEVKYHSFGYGNNKLSQAYQKYEYYEELLAMGIINENGDVNSNKKDEWEFYWRINYSFLIKFSFYFYLLIILLI